MEPVSDTKIRQTAGARTRSVTPWSGSDRYGPIPTAADRAGIPCPSDFRHRLESIFFMRFIFTKSLSVPSIFCNFMPVTNNPLPMENKEEKFQIRTYSKGELAALYNPALTPDGARHTFARWLRFNEKLWKELHEWGYSPHSRLLTPVQVGVIVRYLGEP